MGTLEKDQEVLAWTKQFELLHGHIPLVSQLPIKLQEKLGKKVFEYADYRDEHVPLMNDETCYTGCLMDHGVFRDRPDVFDWKRSERDFHLGREGSSCAPLKLALSLKRNSTC